MRRLVFVFVLVCVILVAQGQNARATSINFDNVADGTVINTFYSGLGVTFNNPIGGNIFARTFLAASLPNVVSVFATGVPAFDARFGAVEAVFALPQQLVSIDAAILRDPEGLGTPTNFPELEVFDTGGTLIMTVPWDFTTTPEPPAGGITSFQTLSFTSSSANIGKVRILSGQPGGNPSNFGLFDNLNFSQTISQVPEPSATLLLGLGLATAWMLRRRATRHKTDATS